jgi:hypothetical protein
VTQSLCKINKINALPKVAIVIFSGFSGKEATLAWMGKK